MYAPKMMPVPPQHTLKAKKLMGVVHRLQQIMVNENLTPAELVGCAEIVRDNYGRLYDISNPKIEAFTPERGQIIPPPRRP
ncbi:hypothetical protein SEEN567_13254 [Salmonella enterica subsp. enterica serovar Newport str. CVM 19567]|nr:hypothetical protein SEEN567_13254 [Salmonella enterica subsp. enterica serovar Newport str. CVM 19567]